LAPIFTDDFGCFVAVLSIDTPDAERGLKGKLLLLAFRERSLALRELDLAPSRDISNSGTFQLLSL